MESTFQPVTAVTRHTMRELDGRCLVSRVKGPDALRRSLARLVIRTARYGQHRARGPEVLWACRLLDALQAAQAVAAGPMGAAGGPLAVRADARTAEGHHNAVAQGVQ